MKSVVKILLGSLLLPVFLLTTCHLSNKKNKTPGAYDLNNPEKFIMPGSLLEISGICFYKGNPDTIYAIQDEDGKVFHLAWGNKKHHNTKFGKKGDYEDIAIVHEKVFVLRSNGTIVSFAKKETDLEEPATVNEWKELLPKGEYEGMYGDELTGKLYILCKKCKTDDSDKNVIGYIYDVRDSIMLLSNFSIDAGIIKSSVKKLRSGFLPSALAKNPLTGEWFILSAYNKLLVITDSAWKIKDMYPISGNTFNQAEGIAFDSGGNLYISNEGDDETNGNILLFKRK